MLSFTIHDLGGTQILECKGRLTIESAGSLRKGVMAQPHGSVVVLDFKEVTGVDAAGLGVLASLQAWAQRAGTEIKLMNLMPRVERTIELTGLKSVFTICSGRDLLDLWCLALRYEHMAPPLKQAAGF